MKFVDDDDDDDIKHVQFSATMSNKVASSKEWCDSFVESGRRRTFVRQLKLPF